MRTVILILLGKVHGVHHIFLMKYSKVLLQDRVKIEILHKTLSQHRGNILIHYLSAFQIIQQYLKKWKLRLFVSDLEKKNLCSHENRDIFLLQVFVIFSRKVLLQNFEFSYIELYNFRLDNLQLIELFIVVTLHIGINTTDNIEDDTHDDDKTRTRDEKIYITCGCKKSECCIEFCHEVWKHCDKREKSTTEEIQTIRDMLKHRGSFFSWTSTRDISSSFLDTFSDFRRIKCDRHIEKWKPENKKKVCSDIYPARILHRKICREPVSYVSTCSTSSFSKNLTDKRRKSDKGNSKDNWHHSCLIHTDRKMRSFIPASASIYQRNFSISLSKSNDNIDHSNCKESEYHEKCDLISRKIIEDMLRHSRKDSSKDNNRRTISDTELCYEITEPEEDHRPRRDKCHSGKDSSEKILCINNRSPSRTCTNKAIEEKYHPIALCKCERNSEVSCIVIDFLLSLFSFFFETFQRRNDHSKKLDNDRRIDIWGKSHEYNRKVLKSSTHHRTKKCKLCICTKLLSICCEECDIYTWNGYIRKEWIHCDHKECEDNFFADMRSIPDFFSICDHGEGYYVLCIRY